MCLIPPHRNFYSVVGSEFVQKYLGEGPRMVRDVFRLVRSRNMHMHMHIQYIGGRRPIMRPHAWMQCLLS